MTGSKRRPDQYLLQSETPDAGRPRRLQHVVRQRSAPPCSTSAMSATTVGDLWRRGWPEWRERCQNTRLWGDPRTAYPISHRLRTIAMRYPDVLAAEAEAIGIE